MDDDEIEFWRECLFVTESEEYAKKYDPEVTGAIVKAQHNAYDEGEEESEEEDG